eukprot:TRINITY_DN4171_c0_g1_i2.p5 TRINITY_DN4171_c0_g1~~TRINITY_DN4171_c0_g1_i2.p5  ORF type:complete len:183 (-),score=24.58 TRINITY_DN4171_c0_g1_i2:2249-2755(-)
MEINNCFISPANNSSNNEENINVLTGLRRRRNNNNNVMNINEKPSLLLSENEGNYEQNFVEDPLNFDPPQEFVCPLTKKVMVEPTTILETRVTCEKSAYISYIRKGGEPTCPKTLVQLNSIEYENNMELTKEISTWMNSKGKIWRGYDDWIYRLNAHNAEERAFKQIL